MKNIVADSRITETNKLEFNQRGWTLVDLQLPDSLIKTTVEGLKKIKRSAIEKDYKPRRIYYDHLFKNNIAAIELPFNKKICNQSIKSFFVEAQIGSLVKTIMNWDNPCCDLSRLFCMGNYKYRGNWHRDYDSDLENIHLNSNLRNIVLVGINLLEQRGFRILKKEYDFNGKNSIIENKETDNAIRSFPFPLSPPQDSYHEINAKIGTALLFDPLLIHQGSSYRERLDFHMKFHNSRDLNNKKNSYQDFSVIDILHEKYKLDYDYLSKFKEIPLHNRSPFFNRITTSIDYRTCLRRILKIIFLKNYQSYKELKDKGWQLDKLSNTIFQN